MLPGVENRKRKEESNTSFSRRLFCGDVVQFLIDLHLHITVLTALTVQLVQLCLLRCSLWVRSPPRTTICLMNIDLFSLSGCHNVFVKILVTQDLLDSVV